MTPLEIGSVGLIVILALLALRIPIGLALGSISFLGIWALTSLGTALGTIAKLPYDFSASWELSAIPMFLLMGAIVYRSGLTSLIFKAARLWFGTLPGGLAVATNFACAGFAAASGSSLAASTAMSRIAIPEMLEYKYDEGLATSVVACAGTLGSLIPPSIMFVLYGVFAQQSISQLLIAGILPGILTAAIYTVMIVTRCRLKPELAPPLPEPASREEKKTVLKEVWPLPLLILGVIGGIYSGLTTATEAGAFGAVLAFLITLFNGKSSWRNLSRAVVESVVATATIFFVAVGAVLLTRFMMLSGLPVFLTDLLAQFSATKIEVLIFFCAVYLILGMFLDPIGILLLTLPLLLPAIQTQNMNGIWVGVIVVKFLEIGLITPPVGLNVYAVKSAMGDRVKLESIFRGVGWFLLCEVVIMAMLLEWPEISLFLPNLINH